MDFRKRNIRNTEIRAVKATQVINCDQKMSTKEQNEATRQGGNNGKVGFVLKF